MKHLKHLSIAVSLAASMWGCDGSSPSSPTAPTLRIAPTLSTLGIHTLSGVVSEVATAGQPVEGARVEVSNPQLVSNPHLAARTDESGFYRIEGVSAGLTAVTVSAVAYETVSSDVTIDGDTRLDIEVARTSTYYTLSGVVSELTSTGQAPLEGVQVGENYHHVGVKTDAKGFYIFDGYPNGVGPSVGFSVSFAKEGYETVTNRPTINGDTRLDVQLVRR